MTDIDLHAMIQYTGRLPDKPLSYTLAAPEPAVLTIEAIKRAVAAASKAPEPVPPPFVVYHRMKNLPLPPFAAPAQVNTARVRLALNRHGWRPYPGDRTLHCILELRPAR